MAAETGRSPADVLDACRSLGIVATAATSGLSSDEHQRLRDALGAGDLPPAPRGSTSERPGRVRSRPDVDRPPAKRRLSARTTTRIGLAVFLVVAVVVAVVSLRGQAEDAGRCVDLGDGTPTDVPCREPHDAELVGVLELPDGAFPGEEGVLAAAEPPCRAALEQRVEESERDRLELVLLVPTADTWARGDRTTTCLVEDPEGPLVGSVAGSGG
ncbi:MAG TPA: septum formation family protein [Acidimicrobiales bacterium]|nr:septum formation family protein [Acidimicrobiales bacterium]